MAGDSVQRRQSTRRRVGVRCQFRLYVSADEIPAFMQTSMHQILGTMSKLETVLGPEAQAWAVGAPGQPGDPAKILHYCRRFASAYEELLDWSRSIRGTACPPDYRRLLNLLARYAAASVRTIQQFVSEFVAEIGKIPAHQADPDREPLYYKYGCKIHSGRGYLICICSRASSFGCLD